MIYTGDIGLYLSGCPVPIPECMIYLTQPRVRQIEQFGETNFLTAVQIISETNRFLKEIKEGNSELEELTDFQILLVMMTQSDVKHYFNIFFELVCPEYEIVYNKNDIQFWTVGQDEEKVLKGQITPFNYEFFQKTVRELFSINSNENENYNPANEKAQAIYEKIRKGKEKIQQQRGTSAGEDNKNISLFATYASVLSIGLQMDINIFFDYTVFQIQDSFNRYWAKVQSDFYNKVATTPLMDVSKMEEPEQWTKNLYSSN